MMKFARKMRILFFYSVIELWIFIYNIKSSIMEKFLKILSDRIINVFDENGNEIKGLYKVDLYKSKYSSHNEKSIRLFVDNVIVPKIKYRLEYKCLCGNIINILEIKYLVKKQIKCKFCREDEEKRKNQSEFITNSFKENGRVIKKYREEKKILSNIELINLSNIEFNKESNEFKKNYFINNCTFEEFNNHKKSIISINNINIFDLELILYIKCPNHKKYSQYIYNKKDDILVRFKNIKYICESCKKDFLSSTTRLPKEKLSKQKILCRDCSFSNNTFKVKNIKNINGDRINYQSKPELDLINFCNENSILIKNGPNILYIFNKKEKIYKVDFMINNMLIELKDWHIWHKRQILSGKWKIKEESAINYCKNNNLEYKLIFIKELEEFKNSIKI